MSPLQTRETWKIHHYVSMVVASLGRLLLETYVPSAMEIILRKKESLREQKPCPWRKLWGQG